MSRPFPDVPAHPERICWGCDRYCPAGDLMCGNGSVRTPHPAELFGEDWRESVPQAGDAVPAAAGTPGAGLDGGGRP